LATRSAAKAHRQSIQARLRNRVVKSATKTAVKKAGEAIAAGDPNVARDSVRAAIATLDRAAAKGVIHPNNAARRKSRLLLKFNAAVAALQVRGDEVAPRASKAVKPRAKKASGRASSAKKSKSKK